MRYAIHTLLARTAHAQRNYLRPYLKEMGLSLSEVSLPLTVLPVVGLLALIPSYLLSRRIFFHKDL